MSVDTAHATATRTAVPLTSSGPEAIRAARELAALDATGLLGITVPRVYGGPDLPATVLAGARLANGMAEWGGPHARDLRTRVSLPPNHGQL